MTRILSVPLNVLFHGYFPVSVGGNYFDCMLGFCSSSVALAAQLFCGHPASVPQTPYEKCVDFSPDIDALVGGEVGGLEFGKLPFGACEDPIR